MGLEKTKPLDDQTSLAAGRSSKGSCCADRHGQRIAQLSSAKKRSREMGQHLKAITADDGKNHPLWRERSAICGCANYLIFHNYYTVDEVRLAKARTCKKHLLCPFCARTRGAKQVSKYLERFEQVREQNPHLVPAMLTLTVKNGDDLEERFAHLVSSFRRFQEKRRNWIKHGYGFNEFCRVDGCVFSFEITYSKETGWHPHLHAVVMLDSYIDQKQLSQEWEQITGDSKIVDIRKLRADEEGSMAEAFVEVFKYALKFSEMPLDQNVEAYTVLRGKRLQGAFGSFWGVKVPETATDELLDDLPYIEMFYKFAPQKGVYDLCAASTKEAASGISEPTTEETVDLATGELTVRELPDPSRSDGKPSDRSRSYVPAIKAALDRLKPPKELTA